MNHETGICECIAGNRPPAPTTDRMTSGTGTCSPVGNQYFVDSLTRLSITSVRKSPNMIWTTGRRLGDRGAGERELGDRHVEDALRPVLLVEPGRDREHAACDRDVRTLRRLGGRAPVNEAVVELAHAIEAGTLRPAPSALEGIGLSTPAQ
jgi:hypothetical protein